jgi:hypothetical protein
MTEISENNKEFDSENEQVTNSENEEKKLCRIRYKKEVTIKLDEFNLEHPFEIFYVPGHEGDGKRSSIATIKPRNKKFQEDHRITSLSFNIGNRIRNKTIFRYNNKETTTCGPKIEWPVKNYGDGYIKVRSDGSIYIDIGFTQKNDSLKRKRVS